VTGEPRLAAAAASHARRAGGRGQRVQGGQALCRRLVSALGPFAQLQGTRCALLRVGRGGELWPHCLRAPALPSAVGRPALGVHAPSRAPALLSGCADTAAHGQGGAAGAARRAVGQGRQCHAGAVLQGVSGAHQMHRSALILPHPLTGTSS
jgi:hypothetical protein